MAATAWPALPPEEQISDEAPRSLRVLHMYAIPLSLNEPLGWLVSILRRTRQPASSESGMDSSSGVGDAIRLGGMATAGAVAALSARRRSRGATLRIGGFMLTRSSIGVNTFCPIHVPQANPAEKASAPRVGLVSPTFILERAYVPRSGRRRRGGDAAHVGASPAAAKAPPAPAPAAATAGAAGAADK